MKPLKPLRVLLVLGILFLPAIAYFLLSSGKNNFKKLQIFGPKEIGSTKLIDGKTETDTVYHQVPSFQFTDQYGRTVSDLTFSGHITVADFFFTSCKTICPDMSIQMERIQNKFINDTGVTLLSYTVDPLTDSIPVLNAYSTKYHVVKDKWYLLTGDKTELFSLAKNGYFLAAFENTRTPDAFDHSDQLVLVDQDHHIRGYYDGTDVNEVNRLMDEIVVLQYEYKMKNKY